MGRDWKVLLDVEDLKSGQFDDKVLAEVGKADSFLLILSLGALENCVKQSDWLRKEIRRAI